MVPSNVSAAMPMVSDRTAVDVRPAAASSSMVRAANEQPTDSNDAQAGTGSLHSPRLTALETLAEADADDTAETLWLLRTGVNGGNARSLDNLQSASRGRRGPSW